MNPRYGVFVFMALMLGSVVAQQEERAAELLARVQQQLEAPTISSLQARMTMTIYDDDGQVDYSTETDSLIDYANRRMRFTMTSGFGDEPSTAVIRDGQMQTLNPETGEVESQPLSEEERAHHESMFDIVDGILPDDYEIVSYDGEVSYAGLLAGEQVTVRASIPTGEVVTTRMICGPDDHFLGAITEMPDGITILTRFDGFDFTDGYPETWTMTTYWLEDDDATLWMEMVAEDMVVDLPVDDAMFDLE